MNVIIYKREIGVAVTETTTGYVVQLERGGQLHEECVPHEHIIFIDNITPQEYLEALKASELVRQVTDNEIFRKAKGLFEDIRK